MASNKRMVDIEREINNFFASDEFKELALANGACRDYCNADKFCIYDNTSIELIYKCVNNKIREIVDNTAINMYLKENGLYMECDPTDREKCDICIGHLIVTECGFGGRKNNWIIRLNNEYVYYTFQFHSEQVLRHYRILDVKENI